MYNLLSTSLLSVTVFHDILAQVPAITQPIASQQDFNKGIALFFAGSMMGMVVYHLFLFALYRKSAEYLYLALLCICIMMRTLTLHRHQILLRNVFDFDIEYFKKIEYFSVYFMMAVFPLYIKSIFKEEFSDTILKVFVALGVIFSFITIVTPYNFYFYLLNYSHTIFVIEFIVVGYVLYKALKNKRPESRITLWGIVFTFPIIFNEILMNSGVIPPQKFKSLLELALLIFLLFQAYILAKRNAKAFQISELINVGLEKAVSEKTEALTTSNNLKDTLLAIISHDVKSPLNSIKGTLSLLNSNGISPEEITQITQQLEDQVQNTSILVDNILHWSASQSRAIQVEKANINLSPLVDECCKLFTYQANKKRINLISSIDKELYVIADPNIIRLVLRNLVSNALKFSHEGGTIRVSYEYNNFTTCLHVQDNGIGMSADSIKSLFNIDKNVSRLGTKQELGTGLGLSLCKKFLEAMDSTISVESFSGKGTKFTIALETTALRESIPTEIHSNVA